MSLNRLKKYSSLSFFFKDDNLEAGRIEVSKRVKMIWIYPFDQNINKL